MCEESLVVADVKPGCMMISNKTENTNKLTPSVQTRVEQCL